MHISVTNYGYKCDIQVAQFWLAIFSLVFHWFTS
jgi:hypothetical protein